MADALAQKYLLVFNFQTLPMKELKKRHLDRAPLKEVVFTEQFVRRKLLKLKETSASGPDELHTRVLKRCASS